MSEIDITMGVAEQEHLTFAEDFAARHDDQREYESQLIYSPADEIQFLINMIRLQDGDWQPDPHCAQVEVHYMQ